MKKIISAFLASMLLLGSIGGAAMAEGMTPGTYEAAAQAPCTHALTALLSPMNQPSPLDDSCGSFCFRYCHVLPSIVFQVLWISIACLEDVVRTRDY